MKRLEVQGKTYHSLTIVEDVLPYIQPSGQTKRRVLCRCVCGTHLEITLTHIISGHTQSCGCDKIKKLTKHGKARTRTYNIWRGMVMRATGKYCVKYYADRGITCDPRWLNFAEFLKDMGECPAGLSLERENNSKGCFKTNCCWATRKEQSRNMRSNRILKFRGESLCLSAMAEKYGISHFTLNTRLREGWTLSKALTQPIKAKRMLTYKGETLSVFDFSKRYGMSSCALNGRLKIGWSLEKALTTPLHK